MRLWSGTQIAYGKDGIGPSIVAMGASKPYDTKHWKLDLVKPDGTRIWRPLDAGEMNRIQAPASDELISVLKSGLSELQDKGIHPAIKQGLENEAERLYPESDPTVGVQFKSLVEYLKKEFGLDEEEMSKQSTEHYVDGFGPDLLVMINNKPVLLPELPEVWLAPGDWQEATWRVMNGMIGPIADQDIPPEKQLQFTGDFPDPSRNLEGLIYYQAARAMVAWAAWENDKQARFVKELASIIMNGNRPIKNRI